MSLFNLVFESQTEAEKESIIQNSYKYNRHKTFQSDLKLFFIHTNMRKMLENDENNIFEALLF